MPEDKAGTMNFKIEHIGIAVKNAEASIDLFSRLLGRTPYKSETVEHEKVITHFFETGESKIELLQGIGDNNPISRFIEKRGEGIHHIAFKVDDIKAEIEKLKIEGFEFRSDDPKPGADNKLICFLHPKSTNGVLIELCQEI